MIIWSVSRQEINVITVIVFTLSHYFIIHAVVWLVFELFYLLLFLSSNNWIKLLSFKDLFSSYKGKIYHSTDFFFCLKISFVLFNNPCTKTKIDQRLTIILHTYNQFHLLYSLMRTITQLEGFEKLVWSQNKNKDV